MARAPKGPNTMPLQNWENLLRDVNPVRQAEQLAAAVLDPLKANPEECWYAIWTKPLFANTRVSTGEKAVKKLKHFMTSAWNDWGAPNGAIQIEHLGGYSKRENFVVHGAKAEAIDKLGIGRQRLLAIQGGAALMRKLEYQSPTHPFQPLAALGLKERVERIQTGAGHGWGHITALHLLTDFGLAIKPDRHVVRTLRALGSDAPLPETDLPSLGEAIAINEAVDKLGERLFDADYGPAKRRYLDKILMELSRQDLLDKLNDKDNA